MALQPSRAMLAGTHRKCSSSCSLEVLAFLCFAQEQGIPQVSLAHASKQSILSHLFIVNLLSFLGHCFKPILSSHKAADPQGFLAEVETQ